MTTLSMLNVLALVAALLALLHAAFPARFPFLGIGLCALVQLI
jgi:uncharacterized membrane protein